MISKRFSGSQIVRGEQGAVIGKVRPVPPNSSNRKPVFDPACIHAAAVAMSQGQAYTTEAQRQAWVEYWESELRLIVINKWGIQ